MVSRLTDFTYGLFASNAYLKARAHPVRSELLEHEFVGYMDELLPSPQLHYLDDLAPQHRLRVSSSGMLAQLAAVRAGLGFGVLAHFLIEGMGWWSCCRRGSMEKNVLACHPRRLVPAASRQGGLGIYPQ